MAINRYELIGRHNPILEEVEYKSPYVWAMENSLYGGQAQDYRLYMMNTREFYFIPQSVGWHTSQSVPPRFL